MTPLIGTNARALALAQAVADAGDDDVTVLCADDYEEAMRIMRDAAPRLASEYVINLTSGTSAQAREVAELVEAHGGRYLDGALMAHPEHVGNPDTVLVYSGDAEVFERYEKMLKRWGSATYLGADAGTAALYDLAMLNVAWATLIGFLQTAALMGTAQIRAQTVAPLLTHWLSTTVTDVINDYAEQIDRGDYPGEQEWLELDAPLMDHLVDATATHGLDTALPELIRALTRRGIDAGHGSASFASLVEVVRRAA